MECLLGDGGALQQAEEGGVLAQADGGLQDRQDAGLDEAGGRELAPAAAKLRAASQADKGGAFGGERSQRGQRGARGGMLIVYILL
jgi:hypothetical protein